MLQENMGRKEVRVYPGQKPIPLMVWILKKYAKPGHLILDPFCGSGSTAAACEILGYRWIAIDKNIRACEIAKKRIKKESQQLVLF